MSDVDATTQVLEVYWTPGCSSCLRMKEFVSKMDIPFEEINAAANPERVERLRGLGLSVPAAVLGDVGVPGLNLVGIAKMVGFDYNPPPILPPSELKEKYDRIIDVAVELFDQIPVEGLEYKSPDRDRSLRSLSVHIGTIMRAFLEAYETDVYLYESANPPEELAATATKAELATWALSTRELFNDWWKLIGYDDAFDRVITAHSGFWTLQELLERAVWHTTQHVRQLQFFLEGALGVQLGARLTDELLAGLPLPEGIHA